MKPTRIEISLKTLLSILLLIAGVYVILQIRDILVLVMVSFILMTALQPVVTSLQKLHISRALAVLIVYSFLIAFLVLAGIIIVPPLITETKNLLIQFHLPDLPIVKELTELTFTAEHFSNLLSQYGSSLGSVVGFITSTFSALFSIFTILIMTLYLLLEREHLYRYAAFLFRTPDRNDRSRKLLSAIELKLGGWVRGEIVLMVIIGVMTYIGLTILDVPYAIPLSILAGILETLPNLGPTIAAIPATIIAFFLVSPMAAVATVVLYTLIQAVENYIIVPQVMKNAVGIRPTTSIILILVGVRFGGVMGALLIIPLYIMLRVTLREFAHEIQTILSGREM